MSEMDIRSPRTRATKQTSVILNDYIDSNTFTINTPTAKKQRNTKEDKLNALRARRAVEERLQLQHYRSLDQDYSDYKI